MTNMNRIKELRNKRGLTLDEMAQKTGIKRGTLNNYENGKTEPKLITWQKLASFFEVTVGYLQGISDIENFGTNTITDAVLEKVVKSNSELNSEKEKNAFIDNMYAQYFLELGELFVNPNPDATPEEKAYRKTLEKAGQDTAIAIGALQYHLFYLSLDIVNDNKKAVECYNKICDLVEEYFNAKND